MDSKLGENETEKEANNEIKLSSSVQSVLNELEDPVSTSDVVNSLLHRHPEYAKGKAKGLDVKGGDIKKSAKEWLGEVFQLFIEINRLNGRLVIFGLSLIDKDLGNELNKNEFIWDLISEIEIELKKSIGSILSQDGDKLWEDNSNVPIHLDEPSEIDKLSREAFAQVLANHLRNILVENKQSGAFLLNITGPWGSGKTSFLKYLSNYLEGSEDPKMSDTDKWIVINFNAWQHQHCDPPWWSLMNTIYEQALRELLKRKLFKSYIKLLFKEKTWRLFSLQTVYKVFFGVFVILTVIIFGFPTKFTLLLSKLNADDLELFSQAFTVVGLVLSALNALLDSLFLGSSNAALNYVRTAQNPVDKLSKHFTDLVEWIPRPITIFIDDLDRCQDKYVVELLEGIQTLFSNKSVMNSSNKSVIYIIAADRRWLYTSYKNYYSSFCDTIEENGRPLDQMFLEKTFQLTFTIPNLSSEIQDYYWKYLIGLKTSNQEIENNKSRQDAIEDVRKITTPHRIMKSISDLSNENTAKKNRNYDKSYREEAIIQLSKSPYEKTYTNSLLQDFAPFVNSNPRQMKRLVNAYRIQRDIAILYGLDTNDENLKKLVLWTIITLQWPDLAEYLQSNPKEVNEIKEDSFYLELLPENVKIILSNLNEKEKVHRVLNGKTGDKDIKVFLDEKSICLFTKPVT